MARFEFKDPLMLLAEANAEIERLESRLQKLEAVARAARDVVSPICCARPEAICAAREKAWPKLEEALRAAYLLSGTETERDTATLYWAAGYSPPGRAQAGDTYHNARDDAIWQARCVQGAMEALRVRRGDHLLGLAERQEDGLVQVGEGVVP